MNKKLLAGLATAGILAGGGGAAALAATGTQAAAASAVPAASSTAQIPAYGPLGSLVSKGTITQAQATAIHNALSSYLREHWQDMRKDCTGTGPAADHTPWMLEQGGALDTVLGQLVKDHTITKSQASAVTSAYTQWMDGQHGMGHGHGYHGDGDGMRTGPGNGMM